MARIILALNSCNWPCQNGSSHSGTQIMQLAVPEWLEPFLHSSSHATGRVRMARAIRALKSCNLHGCARMARAILAHKFGQWHYLRARMARAILALPTIFKCHNGLSHFGTAIYAIFECQNGSSHSGTQIMHPAVPKWLEPFWHLSHVICMAVPEWLEPFWHCQQYLSALHNGLSHSGPVSCTLLVCMNGSSHSGIANNI